MAIMNGESIQQKHIVNVQDRIVEEETKHSDEMQEIIGAPPAWLLRWGISFFFLILVLILGILEVIRYPDIAKTQLKIRSFNLPQPVMANVSGKLIKLLVQNNELVKTGQSLANIESANGIFALVASQDGKLTYAGIVHENQQIFPNQDIFFIANNKENDFFGEMIIQQSSMGKVKSGQEVMIKLVSYPYEEYGMLHGTIKYITDSTFNEGARYVAEVDFNTKNITDMHKPLDLRQGMMAEADIITQNSSLFTRMAGNILKNVNH